MRRYPDGNWKRHAYVRSWLAANEELARYTEYLAKQYELPDTVSFR